MKVTASFEDGSLSLHIHPETTAEQKMIGACIDQPQGESGSAYMDKTLISAVLHYDGHWTNKCIKSVKMTIYRPNPLSPKEGVR